MPLSLCSRAKFFSVWLRVYNKPTFVLSVTYSSSHSLHDSDAFRHRYCDIIRSFNNLCKHTSHLNLFYTALSRHVIFRLSVVPVVVAVVAVDFMLSLRSFFLTVNKWPTDQPPIQPTNQPTNQPTRQLHGAESFLKTFYILSSSREAQHFKNLWDHYGIVYKSPLTN